MTIEVMISNVSLSFIFKFLVGLFVFAFIFFFVEAESHCLAQVGLELKAKVLL